MGKRVDTPIELQAVVRDAIGLLSPKVAAAWSYDFDGNSVNFRGPGPQFTVRDKDGFFTITYEYSPNKKTTRHYDHETTVRFVLQLFHRPAVGEK